MTATLNKLEVALNNTRKSIREVCSELNIDIPEHVNIDRCCNCNIWGFKLKVDLDGHPICGFCLLNYGE
jgi:hypothetical protein